MKYKKLNMMISALLISAMLCGMTTGASEPMKRSEDRVPAVLDENAAGEEPAEGDEGVEGNVPVPDMPEDSGSAEEDEKDIEDPDKDSQEEDKESSEGMEDEEREDSGPSQESSSEDEEESDDDSEKKDQEEEALPDEATMRLLQEYEKILQSSKLRTAVGTYSSELAKFPASYQTHLKKLHEKHPKWIFSAVNTGLNWNDVVKEESQYDRSLLPLNCGSLLLSKAPSDYNASKGTYIPKDGSTWVTASRPAAANYIDPRNFLVDEYIYMFEALNYNASYHNLAGVENILAGTDLHKKTVSYINTKGNTVKTKYTYGELIYAAGKANKVSPLFLASKIRQETGGSLSNGSISGRFSYGGKSYRGYYNFYNIGAYATSTGSAVANGLYYAKGGADNAKSYGRPWTSPALAIDGGAKFLAESYISKGQNTIYFEKFNTSTAPYYQHQYMQNLTGAASEAWTTYNSYKSMGIIDDAYVFYIPVYKNMPLRTNTVEITKNVKKGKTISNVNMRKGPSTSYGTVLTIPSGAVVTVDGGVYTDRKVTIPVQQANPYWLKVSYQSKTGYISAEYLKMNSDSTIKPGGKKKLSVTGTGAKGTIYYETSNPAVAKVSADGTVTGVKAGTCMIYAVSSSGRKLDVIGITVKETSGAAGTLSVPILGSASNTNAGIKVTWKSVTGAEGYYVYRKVYGGKWNRLAVVNGGKIVSYTDKTAQEGKTYYYTVSAYKGSVKSAYSSQGVSVKRAKYVKYRTTCAVNFRSGPGTSYSQKGTLSKGTVVQIVRGGAKKAGGYTWYKMYRNKKYYYIASKYLKRVL